MRDSNHDGQVTANEMVFATTGSDLEGLAQYDTNHDGVLNASDADFSQFAVWQDVNSNGVVDAGEMTGLMALGIASISLSSDGVGYSAAEGDVQVVGTGTVTYSDGSTGVLADAVFSTGSRAGSDPLAPTSAMASNASLISAVAAAGLVVSVSNSEDHDVARASGIQQDASRVPLLSHELPVAVVETHHGPALEFSRPIEAAGSPIMTPHHIAQLPVDGGEHGLTAPGISMVRLTELLHGTDARIGVPVELPALHGMQVSAVSAPMLESAMNGVAHYASVEKGSPSELPSDQASHSISEVLADALHGGHAPVDINALLDAATHHQGLMEHPLAELATSDGHHPPFAAMFFAHGPSALEPLALHYDAPPAT